MTAYIYDTLEKEKNGKKMNITIQQITPDLVEPVIEHMIDNFLPREPLCRHSKLLEDPVSLESFKSLWRKLMEDGAGIVALLDEGDGSEPMVVGANVTGIARKSDSASEELPGEAFKYVFGAVVQLVKEAEIWERYGVESYLTAVGLSVHRNYHGIGLGADIVRARKKVCEIFDIPMTVTVFTAVESQRIASKDGFETVLEYPYDEFNFTLSNVFRDLEGKINIMVKRYN